MQTRLLWYCSGLQVQYQTHFISVNALAQCILATPELPHGLFEELRAEERRDKKRRESRRQRKLKRIIGGQIRSVKPKNHRFMNFYPAA